MAVERKSVVVNDNIIMPELDNITGPIVTPTKIPIEKIKKMLVHNRTVFECNPKNPEQRVRLGFQNLYTDNFAPEQPPKNPESNGAPAEPFKQDPPFVGQKESISYSTPQPQYYAPAENVNGTNVNANAASPAEEVKKEDGNGTPEAPKTNQEPEVSVPQQKAQQNYNSNKQSKNNHK